jgi:hypothetical protein
MMLLRRAVRVMQSTGVAACREILAIELLAVKR